MDKRIYLNVILSHSFAAGNAPRELVAIPEYSLRDSQQAAGKLC